MPQNWSDVVIAGMACVDNDPFLAHRSISEVSSGVTGSVMRDETGRDEVKRKVG